MHAPMQRPSVRRTAAPCAAPQHNLLLAPAADRWVSHQAGPAAPLRPPSGDPGHEGSHGQIELAFGFSNTQQLLHQHNHSQRHRHPHVKRRCQHHHYASLAAWQYSLLDGGGRHWQRCSTSSGRWKVRVRAATSPSPFVLVLAQGMVYLAFTLVLAQDEV